MKKRQLIILLAGVIAVFLLYRFGDRTVKTGKSSDKIVGNNVSIEDYILQSKATLHPTERNLIDSLEALEANGLAYLELANVWENVGNYNVGALYTHKAAQLLNDKSTFVLSGDKLLEAYQTYGDSAINNNLVKFALASYEAALEIDGKDVDVQLKLGEAYVDGTQEPMKGIVILKNIVDSLPEHIPALLTLGRLSIVSGQYDKAEERLEKALSVDPNNAEAIYFMAVAKEGLGDKKEAVRLLELCKQLVSNPAFSREIDSYINNLKNN